MMKKRLAFILAFAVLAGSGAAAEEFFAEEEPAAQSADGGFFTEDFFAGEDEEDGVAAGAEERSVIAYQPEFTAEAAEAWQAAPVLNDPVVKKNKVTLTWTHTDAEGKALKPGKAAAFLYYVYEKDPDTGVLLQAGKATKSKKLVLSNVPEGDHIYTVRAEIVEKDGTQTYGVMSEEKTADIVDSGLWKTKPVLAAPVLTEEGVKLTWTVSEPADAYVIIRKLGKKAFETFSTEDTAWVDTAELATGSTYSYTVTPVKLDAGTQEIIDWGKASAAKKYKAVDPALAAPEITGAYQSYKTADLGLNVTLTWRAAAVSEGEQFVITGGTSAVTVCAAELEVNENGDFVYQIPVKKVGTVKLAVQPKVWMTEIKKGTTVKKLASGAKSAPYACTVKVSELTGAKNVTADYDRETKSVVFTFENSDRTVTEYKAVLLDGNGGVSAEGVCSAPVLGTNRITIENLEEGQTYIWYVRAYVGESAVYDDEAAIHEFSTPVAFGDCGENVKWDLMLDGTLILSGTGATEDYLDEGTPWYSYADSIKAVVIRKGVTYIGQFLFSSLKGVEYVSIPDSVTSVGQYAFQNCASLENAVLPDTLETLPVGLFYGCEKLVSVTLPSCLTSIDNAVFFNCKSLQSIELPKNLTEIGKGVFQSCESLQSVYLPDKVEKLGANCFSYCGKLEKIRIPAALSDIESETFKGCNSLKYVTYSGTKEKWDFLTSRCRTYTTGNDNLLNLHYAETAEGEGVFCEGGAGDED